MVFSIVPLNKNSTTCLAGGTVMNYSFISSVIDVASPAND
jgi:hypothetical protein